MTSPRRFCCSVVHLAQRWHFLLCGYYSVKVRPSDHAKVWVQLNQFDSELIKITCSAWIKFHVGPQTESVHGRARLNGDFRLFWILWENGVRAGLRARPPLLVRRGLRRFRRCCCEREVICLSSERYVTFCCQFWIISRLKTYTLLDYFCSFISSCSLGFYSIIK